MIKLEKNDLRLEKNDINYNKNDIQLTYKLNKYDKKSFSITIYNSYEKIFFCRLYYNKKFREKLNIDYELSDVYLYAKYRGNALNGIKYSKICINMINSYLEKMNIKNIILWTLKDNVKAIKRYTDIGFTKVFDEKVIKYFMKMNKIDNKDIEVYWKKG